MLLRNKCYILQFFTDNASYFLGGQCIAAPTIKRIADGGFFLCPWDGTEETEAQIKAETQATIRCVPYGYSQENLGVDMVSGKPSKCRVIIARSY